MTDDDCAVVVDGTARQVLFAFLRAGRGHSDENLGWKRIVEIGSRNGSAELDLQFQ